MSVRAIRGAIQIEADTSALMKDAVIELMSAIFERNNLTPSDLISVLFTCTPDITSDFPAAYARELGLEKVPLICAVEMNVPGSLPRTIRALLHVESNLSQEAIGHVYLRGAVVLRKDIAQ